MTFYPVELAGPCHDGRELGAGTLAHLYSEPCGSPSFRPALCGAIPGRRSGGFYPIDDDRPRKPCPRCARRAAKLEAPSA